MTNHQLRRLRRNTLARLRRLIHPLLRESGYVDRKYVNPRTGFFDDGFPRRYLRLFCRKDSKAIPLSQESAVAVTEYGLMTDASGSGAVTVDWRSVSLDDLFALESYVRKNLKQFE